MQSTNYVQQGGTVVGSYMSAEVDEQDLASLGDNLFLKELYGVNLEETDTLYPSQHNTVRFLHHNYQVHDYCAVFTIARAQKMGHYLDDFYQKQPAITVNYVDKGKAYFLGARGNDDLCQAFYDQIAATLVLVAEPFKVLAPPTVSVRVRCKGPQKWFFVLNFSEQAQRVKVAPNLYNDLTGQKLNVSEVELRPYQTLILRCEN